MNDIQYRVLKQNKITRQYAVFQTFGTRQAAEKCIEGTRLVLQFTAPVAPAPLPRNKHTIPQASICDFKGDDTRSQLYPAPDKPSVSTRAQMTQKRIVRGSMRAREKATSMCNDEQQQVEQL